MVKPVGHIILLLWNKQKSETIELFRYYIKVLFNLLHLLGSHLASNFLIALTISSGDCRYMWWWDTSLSFKPKRKHFY